MFFFLVRVIYFYYGQNKYNGEYKFPLNRLLPLEIVIPERLKNRDIPAGQRKDIVLGNRILMAFYISLALLLIIVLLTVIFSGKPPEKHFEESIALFLFCMDQKI